VSLISDVVEEDARRRKIGGICTDGGSCRHAAARVRIEGKAGRVWGGRSGEFSHAFLQTNIRILKT